MRTYFPLATSRSCTRRPGLRCGMLRLSYLQTSLGLGPVFLFTVPAVLAGAFMTKLPSSGLGGMETLAMIVLLLMNMVFSLGMMFLTNKVITQEKEALAAIPDDVEVKQADEANARATAARREATKFAAMPNGVRALLVTSTVMRVVSAYALFFVPSRLFQPFAITDCSDTLGANSPYTSFLGKSLGASWLGVMALGLLVLTILLGQVYGMWYAPCQTGALARAERSHAQSARTHRALARTGRSHAQGARHPRLPFRPPFVRPAPSVWTCLSLDCPLLTSLVPFHDALHVAGRMAPPRRASRPSASRKLSRAHSFLEESFAYLENCESARTRIEIYIAWEDATPDRAAVGDGGSQRCNPYGRINLGGRFWSNQGNTDSCTDLGEAERIVCGAADPCVKIMILVRV